MYQTSHNALSINSLPANGNGYPQPNGHNGHHHVPSPSNAQRSASQPMAKEPVRVIGIPHVQVLGNQLVHGDAQSSSERSYTPIKIVGDGSFGTVLLVDWHTLLPPNTPLSPMQRGGGARQEWIGKRLVALKRMKKKWEGGWDECRKLKELESLRAIPFHPSIIPLYDFFLLPSTKELYFVFEPMEGNLYQLIKSRRGRPLAGGLVSSIFRQVVSGLHHIHDCGYFHRDMKPENLLVTTTGLYDYRSVSPVAPPTAPPEKDVVVIVKLADFGLARETRSKPPYTEYVSTRWYRAPEVLLRSRDYSSPVDLWALGTIIAELISLKPLFPGQTEPNQVARICEILGDPSDEYGVDSRGCSIGGGKWVKGLKMARAVGFTFPKIQPIPIHSLFDRSIPLSLIECIADLLKYDPDVRLTSRQCLEHPYLVETSVGNIPPPPQYNDSDAAKSSAPKVANRSTARANILIRSPPNMNSSFQCNGHVNVSLNDVTSTGEASASHQNHFSERSVSDRDGDFVMRTEENGVLHPGELDEHGRRTGMPMPDDEQAAAILNSSSTSWKEMVSERMDISQDVQGPVSEGLMSKKNDNYRQDSTQRPQISSQNHRHWIHFPKGHFWPARNNNSVNGDKLQQSILAPVEEVAIDENGKGLKRVPSGPANPSSPELLSPDMDQILRDPKKEARRIAQDAEMQRRIQAQHRSREQSRAVMQKRNQLITTHGFKIEGSFVHEPVQNVDGRTREASPSLFNLPKMKVKSKGQSRHAAPVMASSSSTVNAAGGRFRGGVDGSFLPEDELWRDSDHRSKARRRDLDDDHSMSSSDLQSVSRVSMMTSTTVDSDPGPSRRQQPSLLGVTRMQSTSSLRTSFGDEFPASARSSNSLSFEQQLVHDFDSRASFSSYDAARSSVSESSSPPPMQALSLSGHQQPSSPQSLSQQKYFTLPLPIPSLHLQQGGPTSPYEYGQNGQIQAHPPSPGIAPYSLINPIFKVPPIPSPTSDSPGSTSHHALPPFSQLASVAEHYPPLSPMSFHTPEDS